MAGRSSVICWNVFLKERWLGRVFQGYVWLTVVVAIPVTRRQFVSVLWNDNLGDFDGPITVLCEWLNCPPWKDGREGLVSVLFIGRARRRRPCMTSGQHEHGLPSTIRPH